MATEKELLAGISGNGNSAADASARVLCAVPAEIHVPTFLPRELKEPFLYSPNPGNAGDALMAKATYDLFEKLGLEYESIDHASLGDADRQRGKVVVLGGGGNFAEGGYNNYAEILARIHAKAKQVIVLPHTIHGNTQLLSMLGDNVTLICRERVTYQHVKRHAPRARVHLAHDMALLMEVEKALAFEPRYINSMAAKALFKLFGIEKALHYPTFMNYLAGLSSHTRSCRKSSSDVKVGNLFRTDIERTEITLPPDNLDASIIFNFGVTSPIKAGFTVYHLLKFLDAFDVINTNRLHVAIAAGLLGKQVNLNANNYFKCKAVYDYSLKDAFPNISWGNSA